MKMSKERQVLKVVVEFDSDSGLKLSAQVGNSEENMHSVSEFEDLIEIYESLNDIIQTIKHVKPSMTIHERKDGSLEIIKGEENEEKLRH